MRWSYWGASGEVPEEVGQLRQEGFQSTAWKGTHIPTYVYAFCSTLATHGLRVFSLVLQPLPLRCYYCTIKHRQLLRKHVLSSETLSF